MLDIDERKLKDGELVTIYDPACGTGGMLTALKEFIETNVNEKANVRLYGQEVNDKTWSICEADFNDQRGRCQSGKWRYAFRRWLPEREVRLHDFESTLW